MTDWEWLDYDLDERPADPERLRYAFTDDGLWVHLADLESFFARIAANVPWWRRAMRRRFLCGAGICDFVALKAERHNRDKPTDGHPVVRPDQSANCG